MELDDLAGHRHLVPLLAEWHVREWQHLYPEWTIAIATTELGASTRDGIPHTIVAFDGGGREPADVLGSVSLVADDELPGFEATSPWLSSVYVRADARGTGVGRRLVAAMVDFARDHGVGRLHLFNTDTTAYYARRGWRTVAPAEKNGHAVTVMAIDTDPHAPRRAFATEWCTSPWFRCAYSYLRGLGTPDDRDTITAPIAPGLVLAGEAASREFPGTAHGAWFSGAQAAERICAGAVPPTVIVVGAGLAGIAAARVARDNGADVTVLEATSWIGGRATSSRALGGPVNSGAAWIHGIDGHPLRDAFLRHAAPAESNTFRQVSTFVAGLGELAGPRRTDLERMRGEIETRIALAAETAAAGDTVADVLDAAIADIATDATSTTVLRSWLRGEFENLYAAPPADLSLRHHAEPFRLPGDDVMITVALDDLVAELARDIPITYDSPVVAITRRDDAWHVTTRDTEHVTSAVIVTVPIGVLHADAIEFDPPLPRRVREALERIGGGLVTKAFFSFDAAFWAPRKAFWIAAEPPALFELWVDVSSVRGAPTLCAFAVGDDAVRVERMSEDELLAAALTTLHSATDLLPDPKPGS